MDKLRKLSSDTILIKREKEQINNDSLELELENLDKETKLEKENLEKMKRKLNILNENGGTSEKIFQLANSRIENQKEKIITLEKRNTIEKERIFQLIEINDDLSFIEKVEIDYVYHGKMLGLLETYRNQWEKERGNLRKKRIEILKVY